jgi:hypothetical protein
VLSPYRRHTRLCKRFSKPNPQEFTRCNCPVWCYGVIEGKEVRKSMKMRDWKRALETTERWNKSLPDAVPIVTVKDAVDAFIRHRKMRNMTDSTIASHRKTFVHLVDLCGSKPITSVTLDMLTRLQEFPIFTPNRKGSKPRAIQPSTLNKELKSLRALFAFAAKRKWCEKNVATDLEAAEEDGLPTLPFENNEVSSILEGCDRIMKTRRPMYVSLPSSVIQALRFLPENSPYFFLVGEVQAFHGDRKRAEISLLRMQIGWYRERTPSQVPEHVRSRITEERGFAPHGPTATRTHEHSHDREALRAVCC